MEGFMTNVAIPASYVLALLALGSAIVMPFVNAFRISPKTLVKPLIALAVLLIFYGISWAISGDEVTTIYKTFRVDASASKNIGGALIMTYLLAVAAFLAVVVDKVLSIFK